MDPPRNDDWVNLKVDQMTGLIGLQTTRSSQRLNQIDRVRAHGVGDHIALPQIVVCGDQSAGKSSVLEGITGIPFPRQDGVCTRFATEIILRHQPEVNRITATIIPGASRTSVEQDRVGSNRYRRALSSFDDLPDVIEEAARLMGVRGYIASEDAPAFADDVLRLKIVGNTVSDNESDVEIVEDLVDSYLESTRTIILAVIQANNDIDTQGIIQRARRFDKAGERTVGIITKPDLINKGTEARITTLARNLAGTKLKLGFFLLKNSTPLQLEEAISWEERTKSELQFFRSSPWKEQNLDWSRVGVEKLRCFLQDLLDSHIERELPKVRKEVQSLLLNTGSELKQLGAERSTTGQIRMFLTHVSMDFYNLVKAASEGTYEGRDGDFFDLESSRLRALVHKENGRFARYMQLFSEKRKLWQKISDSDLESDTDSETDQLLVTQEEMEAWAKEIYLHTRGRELPGNYNHVLLSEMFHDQSSRWAAIAKDHLQKISTLVAAFVSAALAYAIRDTHVRANVQNIVDVRLEQNEKAALEELQRLLNDEQCQPITYNHYFTDNVQTCRQGGLKKQLEESMRAVIQNDWNGKSHNSNTLAEFEKLVASLKRRINIDMDQQACSEALTGLKAYYKVAMKTFVDNICRQVVERHIMRGLMDVLDPVRISELSDDELYRIASESPQLQARRQEMEGLKQALEKSLRELRD